MDFTDWNRKATLVITYDPVTDELVVDRGELPHLFAAAILQHLEDDFRYSDEEYSVDHGACGEDD